MSELKAKKNWVTANDVALLAKVSRSAVSRTFTPGASVSDKTRKAVEAAAKELGYQVNIIARSMNTGSSNFIGLVTSGFDNPFRNKLLSPIVKRIALKGYIPLLINAGEPKQLEPKLRELFSYHVAGVILTSGAPPISLVEEYVERKIPVALINKQVNLAGTDQIFSDNQAGMQLVTDQLLKHNVSHIGFIGDCVSFSAQQRYQFLQTQLKNVNLEVSSVFTSSEGYQAGWQAASNLLKKKPNIDSLFCATDILAIGAMDYLRHIMPDRMLPIIGFDDIPQASTFPYQLTTVRQDTEILAENTVKLLMNRIRNFQLPSIRTRVPVELIVRKSA
ncbi:MULTISPECIES: LacI family DNA-binding transcriptional regulator [unclassified Providencia]|uniref:LacI family DNA-binding transcriptional regulator n=1 Tax=unclassified Providencia TaxID=2633465 RepID=UPI001C5BF09D|nr:LacI family DNA-binding transcriptional regulator [Providencia sp. R33]QXX82811.1 LacI family DNA-binding transcriptional regulator [Providencia sp. R33]